MSAIKGELSEFDLEYDHLVVAVGADVITPLLRLLKLSDSDIWHSWREGALCLLA